jgi:hypothetical protein
MSRSLTPTFAHPEPPEELARIVACLIRDDLVRCDEWVAWAVLELMRVEGAPPWLAELSTTYGCSDALCILGGVAGGPTVPEKLGCLWLAYRDEPCELPYLLEAAVTVVGRCDRRNDVQVQQALLALETRYRKLATPFRADDTFDAIALDIANVLKPVGDAVARRIEGRVCLAGESRPSHFES